MANTVREAPEARRRRARVEAILKAAAVLFAREGYERTSLADVADKVDLTPKALYHYYPSKRDLLEAVLVNEFDYFDPTALAAARGKWQGLSLVDALTESSIEALRELFDHGELLRVSFTESLSGSDTTRRRHADFQRNWIEHVTAIVNNYDDIPSRRRDAFADHLVAILFGTAVDAILRPRPEVFEGERGTQPSRTYVGSIVSDLLQGVLLPMPSPNRRKGPQPKARSKR